QLPELEKPQIAAVEGSEATIEAFRRLTTTFYGALAFKLPPSADELRELQKKAVQSVEGGASANIAAINAEQGGLSKRDYVPLAVAVFVDLCLFLVSMVQQSAGRLDGLVPKMRAAERGPVIQILSRFNEIHRDNEIRENFEIFRHVVFDMNGDYYVAVPLDAPPRLNPQEREALRVEAQLLANLFASFEKEKIFKRTMLPTTSSIQKRLKRQGSKFAGSEAFRVYRFADGAWSDIILGAVMGAARRVEANERITTRTIPNTIPPNTMSPPEAPSPAGPPPRAPMPPPMVGNPAANASSPITNRVASVMTAMRRAPVEAPARRTMSTTDPEHASRFGPYADAYQPELRREPPPFARAPQGPRVPWPAPPPHPEAEVTLTPPPSIEVAPSTQLLPHAANDTTVLTMPRKPHGETTTDTIGVTLSRETATFSLPVSEARLPQSLQAALASASHAYRAEPTVALLANDDASSIEARQPSRDVDNEIELSAQDLALIGRMAPEAAE
nr:hypothetical protein [Hyphomicrobium sp.]